MATTLSLSSPLFLAAPAKARDVISHGVASASPSWNTANLPCKGYYTSRAHGRKQQRQTSVVSVFGRKTKTTRETVVPDPDYRLPIAILGIAGAFAYADNLLAAAPRRPTGAASSVSVLKKLLYYHTAVRASITNVISTQTELFIKDITTRVRFVFDDEALEVKVGNQLQESGENVFVGGKNRWKYSTFVNWELWWPQFPILVYFKETQTKPEGQIHFFPVIFNGRQLYDIMVERAGPSETSGPGP